MSYKDIVQYRGKNCSRLYSRLMTLAEHDGVHFTLDSGYRSIREQWRLWNLHRKNPSKYALAAFPGTSTHNKRGWKQGLDINARDGGAERFRRWAARHGMIFRYTVPGEPWHLNAARDYTGKIQKMWIAHEHKHHRR
jgi:LAS superfamily LD-carboxypeptidase LdcB